MKQLGRALSIGNIEIDLTSQKALERPGPSLHLLKSLRSSVSFVKNSSKWTPKIQLWMTSTHYLTWMQ